MSILRAEVCSRPDEPDRHPDEARPHRERHSDYRQWNPARGVVMRTTDDGGIPLLPLPMPRCV